MKTKLEGNEEGASPRNGRHDLQKKAQKEMGNVFNYQDKERNWANASKMAEKNKALL